MSVIVISMFAYHCSESNSKKNEEMEAIQEKELAEKKFEDSLLFSEAWKKRDPSPFTDSISLHKTEIVPTLENMNDKDKNSIYSVGFLFAWQEVQQALKDNIVVGKDNSIDFRLINHCHSFQNSLKDGDYKTAVSGGYGIIAKAYFNQNIPFKAHLDKLDEGLIFNHTKVEAFGLKKYDADKAKYILIYYYLNDDHFVLSIASKNSPFEILFGKGLNLSGTMLNTYHEMEKLIEKGKAEKKERENLWKYGFVREDFLAIPEMKFLIKSNYPSLKRQEFVTSNGDPHVIEEASQEIWFSLDKHGVSIKDNVSIVVDSAAFAAMAKPKKLVFDSPFFFALKRKDSEFPYFAMKVRNEELMVKKE